MHWNLDRILADAKNVNLEEWLARIQSMHWDLDQILADAKTLHDSH